MTNMTNKALYWDLKAVQSEYYSDDDERNIFEIYENLIYQFCLTGNETGIYFEDSFGISGWLFVSDEFCQKSLKEYFQFFNTLEDRNERLKKLERLSLDVILKTRKAEAMNFATLNCDIKLFNKLWRDIPEKTIISLTGKELAWFIGLLKSQLETVEEITQNFYNSQNEIYIYELFELTEEKNLFELIPDWMFARFCSQEIQTIFDFIASQMLKKCLKNLKLFLKFESNSNPSKDNIKKSCILIKKFLDNYL